MDGFVGRKDLISRERLSELARRSNGRGALQTASHFGAIMATGYALHTTLGSLWAIPWFVLHGILTTIYLPRSTNSTTTRYLRPVGSTTYSIV